ncbi:MAG: PHB depolymerase family esterase [Myxococcota bacterium]
MRHPQFFAIALGALVACSTEPVDLEDGGDSGAPHGDASAPDLGAFLDAGGPDASPADLGAPDAGEPDSGMADAGSPCSGQPGTFHDQHLTDPTGEVRSYLLHVPAAYDCSQPLPLLVDFHGTAGDQPEEAYQTDALLALADAEGFIVLRPRSRFSSEGGGNIYRWDQNPGDLAKNVAFTHALVAKIRADYAIDPARTYASGFSSGTNMVSRFLPETGAATLFHGFAFVGGGYWETAPGPLNYADPASAPRIYAVSGFRDYLHGAELDLFSLLDRAHHPVDRRFMRKTDAGHDLFAWHFEEIWAWLDRGARPSDAPLRADLGWTQDTRFPNDDDLTEVVTTSVGDALVTSGQGRIYRRNASGWTIAADFGPQSGLTGICVLDSGLGIAVGATHAYRTRDGGRTWVALAPIPELHGQYFGASYLNSVSCRAPSTFVGAGYWTGVISRDGGNTWSLSDMSLASFPIAAQVAGIRLSTNGSTLALAAGYGGPYLGVSEDGATFHTIYPAGDADWLNDACISGPSSGFVVGDHGSILHTRDGGHSFSDETVPTQNGDLYAVDAPDEQHGIAVGAHGMVAIRTPNIQPWVRLETGLDKSLMGARIISPRQAIVVGEGGLVLDLTY